MHLIEQQRQRFLLGPIAVFEFGSSQKSGKWHHGVLHVHYAPLLLIDMRGIHDEPLQSIQTQGACINVSGMLSQLSPDISLFHTIFYQLHQTSWSANSDSCFSVLQKLYLLINLHVLGKLLKCQHNEQPGRYTLERRTSFATVLSLLENFRTALSHS